MFSVYKFSNELDPRCKGCGFCCGGWQIPVSDDEAKRLIVLGYPRDAFKNNVLAKKDDGKCFFLDENKRCKIHLKHGFDAKPLSCRIFPYDIYVWREDNSVSADLRFECCAAASSLENEIGKTLPFIESSARELMEWRCAETPFYSENVRVSIGRLREISQAYEDIIFSGKTSWDICFRVAELLLNFHSKAENLSDIYENKNFAGESMALFERSIPGLEGVPLKLSFVKKFYLRYLAAECLRNDYKTSLTGRLKRSFSELAYAFGKNEFKTDEITLPFCASKDIMPDEHYKRWLKGKLRSLHFCGLPAKGLTFENGMRYILASFKIWRILRSNSFDAVQAIRLLDRNFLRTGLYNMNPLLRAVKTVTSAD